MFRYISFAWDASQPASTAAARQLSQRWEARPGWVADVCRPGLQVFSMGSRAGINGAVPLQGGRGVVLGKLFRRSDLGSSVRRSDALNDKDAARVLQSGGRALVSDFWGRYIAFLPTSSGTTSVLRDPSGTLPCFWIRYQGVSIVFSWLEDALETLAGFVHYSVDWDALTTQLLNGRIGGRHTGLTGITEILPGELVDLHDDRSELLWNAVEIARHPTTDDASEAMRSLREAVRSCTAAWAACYDTLLLRLSGGVDSSILVSCLSPAQTAADVICINYHSAGSDSDERHYARLAAARAGRDLVERERDAGFKLDRILAAAAMPDPVPYIGWMNAGTDARLASAHGAPAMFTGAGGDPLLFEFPRWWPAADYLHNRGLDAGFATAAMDAARLGRVSVWRAIAMAFKERIRPDPAARAPIGYAAMLADAVPHIETDRTRFVHPAVLEANDLPIGKYTQTVALMHPLGYYDPFEQDKAPELVNPLLSQPLVELCLGLPTYVLTEGGRGRALARRAFAKDLPPQIVSRRSKGGMEEHLKAVLDANLDFVRGMLLEGHMARRGLLDLGRLEELLSGKPTALAGPISQIHGLVAVEAWLQRWTR